MGRWTRTLFCSNQQLLCNLQLQLMCSASFNWFFMNSKSLTPNCKLEYPSQLPFNLLSRYLPTPANHHQPTTTSSKICNPWRLPLPRGRSSMELIFQNFHKLSPDSITASVHEMNANCRLLIALVDTSANH